MPDQPRLRVLLVGASGTLGRAVEAALSPRHDIVGAGSQSGTVRIDIADPASITRGLAEVGPIDAVCCTAGKVNFPPLATVEPAPLDQSVYGLGLANKLMGQVNLALAARSTLRDHGSITLISGLLSETPIAGGSSAAMVNAALEGFVRSAACELPRGLRINLVSPTVFEESMGAYGPFFRGFKPVPVAEAALAFSRSVEGIQTGQIFRAGF
jgi:NAD(P)-dependent dehydrogenase (short-subunit alcohol dehydrogenase family)